MAISIRLLQPHEVELANNFFNKIYQTNRPIENFRWEFLDGPCGKAIYVIAVDDEVKTHTKIVGIQCAIPLEFISSKGQVVLTAKSEDTLVDPTYRGQKIFERMYQLLFDECTKAGIKYIWGFTPAQKAFERIGFEIPFMAEQALLVFKPIKAYNYLKQLNKENRALDRFKILGLCFISWIKQVLTPSKIPPPLKETTIEGKIQLFKEFYPHTDLFTLNQTPEYISWRIRNNPFQNQYESCQTITNNQVTADAILNIRGEVGYLEQMLSSNDMALQQLFPAIVKKFRSKNTALIRVMCFSSNTILNTQVSTLSSTGFTYLKRGNYFVWKSLTPENIIKPQQLFITRLFTQGNL